MFRVQITKQDCNDCGCSLMNLTTMRSSFLFFSMDQQKFS
uniref:Uncharacterized protein n=1 Tax=Arundo donax TaxID=35708 RepID=A0A0A9CB63_ARUDO